MIDINAMAAVMITAATQKINTECLESVAVIIETESKSMIGEYQQGWDKLKDSTEAQKARMGYPANAPLLATGEMRDSIQHHVSGDTAHIGTNDRKMRYHEYGTNRIPPRPVFGLVWNKKQAECLEIIGDATVKLL